MCTPWILKKFLRRRPVVDSMPHFSGSRFQSSGAATEIYYQARSHALRNLATNSKGNPDDRTGNNSLQRTNKERQTINNNLATRRVAPKSRSIHVQWPSCEDEDYIVFSLSGDGEITNKPNDVKPGISRRRNSTGKRSTNQKLVLSESEQLVYNTNRRGSNREELRTIHEKCVASEKMDELEEDSILPEIESSHGSNTRMRLQVHDNEACNIGSNQFPESDSSTSTTSSFAFPVLQWDWIGSPVQMPKAEDLHLKKHKTRCVRLTCCRF